MSYNHFNVLICTLICTHAIKYLFNKTKRQSFIITLYITVFIQSFLKWLLNQCSTLWTYMYALDMLGILLLWTYSFWFNVKLLYIIRHCKDRLRRNGIHSQFLPSCKTGNLIICKRIDSTQDFLRTRYSLKRSRLILNLFVRLIDITHWNRPVFKLVWKVLFCLWNT